MASLRKASSYSKKRARPYTRSSKIKTKSYVKTVPQNKIVKYNLGNEKAHMDGKYPFKIMLIAEERAQIRDNALESCRTLVNKLLEKHIPGQYFFSIKIHPHHFLRENKTAAGAGADRLSSGMKHSFGIIVGRAAMVNPGKEIFMVSTANEKAARIARETLAKVKPKLPCKVKILFERAEGD